MSEEKKTWKVLIMDDEGINLEMISDLIVGAGNSKGYEVEIHKTREPDKALEIMKEEEIDLVITDMDIGRGTNGLELAYNVKKINESVPVIIFTTDHATVEDIKKSEEAGLSAVNKMNTTKLVDIVGDIMDPRVRGTGRGGMPR